MAKVKISDYSTTNSSNTDINSINIDEGCAPSGINNAIREVMVHLKNWQTNASGDGATFASLVVQGTGSFTGAVTMSAGATLSGTNTLSGSNIISGNINSSGSTNTFSGTQVISGNINSSGSANTFSGSVTLSGGTANGVLYLNGSKVATSGSALVFDGTNFSTTGTATATKLIPTGNVTAGNGMYLPTTNTLAWSTNGAEVMRLDSSGNLGLGVTPSAWKSNYKAFQYGSYGSALYGRTDTLVAGISSNWYENSSGSDIYINNGFATRYQQLNGAHEWRTAPSGTAGNAITFTQAMTLDASGNLGVGTTSPGHRLDVVGPTGSGVAIAFTRSGKQPGYLVSDTEGAGFYNNSALNNCYIYLNDTNSFLSLGTANTERARISSGGIVSIGTTSVADFLCNVYNSNTSGYAYYASCNSDGSTYTYLAGYSTSSSAYRIKIYTNGNIQNTNNSYGTLASERRFKQDIVDVGSQWDDIKNIRLRKFRFKKDVERLGDDAQVQLGVIIDELEQVCPNLVTETIESTKQQVPVLDENGNQIVDADGQPKFEEKLVETDTVKGWKSSILYLKAVKALQEAMERIETLEVKLEAQAAEIAALRGN